VYHDCKAACKIFTISAIVVARFVSIAGPIPGLVAVASLGMVSELKVLIVCRQLTLLLFPAVL
jgi:hypothetical protein